VAVRGDLIYVLNAGGKGEVQGYYANSLTPIPGSARTLGLTPGLTPPYLNTPGQIGFTPNGQQLVVTTKANGSDIDVLNVGPTGSLSAPAVNPSATPVPFGFTFDRYGDLVVSEAGTSALTTYAVNANGTITEQASTTNGEAALCWVATAGGFFYGANAGSNTLTGYTIGSNGVPTIVSTTPTDVGPIDLASSPDGRNLYVETGGSDLVDAFTVQPSGSLRFIGSVTTELPGHTGLEGIAVG
jgi:6-phosphogluconolactonase (cycloisomerase 2 family)